MSGSLTLAMRTAQSGLLANQEALNTVSNNISNVNSPGYSRKVVNLEQRVVGGVGSGVQVASVVRKIDEGLLKSLRIEIGSLNALSAKDPYLQRLQELFGTPSDNTALSHVMTEFTNAVDTLAINPSSTMEQSEVVRKGQDVSDKLHRMSATLQELRLQTDADITTATTRIGQLTTTIHTINNKLVASKAINADVTGLRDQRDAALDELSSLIDVQYYYRADGDAVVFTQAGRSLVDNSAPSVSHLAASAMQSTTTHAEGDLNGIYVGNSNSTLNDITTEVRSGKLKGLIDLRDTVFTNIQSQLDEFGAKLRDSVNAVHNAGTSYPGFQSMSGTRSFIDGTQTMKLDGTSDVTIALMDSSGNQTSVTTLNTIMVDATMGTAAQTSHGDWTISEVATTIEDWLKSKGITGAKVGLSNTTNGKLSIDLNTTTSYLAFRDEVATADGSTAQAASITLDTNGAAVGGTEAVSGFSNLFGLNDFFVDDLPDNIQDSKILSPTFTLGAATTLSFHNTSSGIAATIGATSVDLTAGMTLDQMVAQINDTVDIGVVASKVPEGAGFRLRLAEATGDDMIITGTNNFKSSLGMEGASARTSQQIRVRADLVSTPSKIARASLQWDAAKGSAGEYIMSFANGTNITALADQMALSTQFNETGGMTALNVTFTSFSTSIISYSASITSVNDADLAFQQSLSDSLQAKSDNFRGVNLDEEMTNLMAFEQAYGAAARVISTIQKMFDALESIV